MKHQRNSSDQNPQPVRAPQPTKVDDMSADGVDFTPSADEVARRAYFTYVNQGSLSGHEVQHWLAAEAELIAERDRTRVHGFHNRS